MKAMLLRRRNASLSDFQGIPIRIEWATGTTRRGVGPDGNAWSRRMVCDYGYIPDTSAKGDEENVDVYVGPNPRAPEAWVVDQLKGDGSFDEPKVLLGFDSREEALGTYLRHYPAGWESRVGDVIRVTVDRLRELVEEERGEEPESAEVPVGEHRFLTLDELRDAFNTRVLPTPGFQRAIADFGAGKAWDDMNQEERNSICVRHGRREQGDA